jgi:hypothetical protein
MSNFIYMIKPHIMLLSWFSIKWKTWFTRQMFVIKKNIQLSQANAPKIVENLSRLLVYKNLHKQNMHRKKLLFTRLPFSDHHVVLKDSQSSGIDSASWFEGHPLYSSIFPMVSLACLSHFCTPWLMCHFVAYPKQV